MKPEPEGETRRGGIIIPETAQERPQVGTILRMGDAIEILRKEQAPRYRVGSRILFGKFSGTEITVDGEALLLLQSEDVLAILRSPER